MRECMQKTTRREYLAWLAWLDKEWEHPSRTDYYLMQIAAEVNGVLRKKGPLKLDNFKLRFTDDKKQPKKETTQQSKSRWLGLFRAMKVKVKRKQRDG